MLHMNIRQACASDITELCFILNEIIAIGGTTAYMAKLSESDFTSHFIGGSNCISCLIAERGETILGFQSLSYHPKLADGWVDIATFARVEPKTPGVGSGLFSKTVNLARQKKFEYINATIRADNNQGLSFYTKMGFEDYSISRDVPLSNGTSVDRISKRYLIAETHAG